VIFGNALSACNPATCRNLTSLSCLKPVQVKRVLSSRNTAVSSRSLLDGQTDSQPVIGGSCLSGGDRFGAAVLSLRPVNPKDLQSRLISEQIAESEREINGFRPGVDAHILPVRRVGLSGGVARVMSGSVHSSAPAQGLCCAGPGARKISAPC
jgi:hypothetical protein